MIPEINQATYNDHSEQELWANWKFCHGDKYFQINVQDYQKSSTWGQRPHFLWITEQVWKWAVSLGTVCQGENLSPVSGMSTGTLTKLWTVSWVSLRFRFRFYLGEGRYPIPIQIIIWINISITSVDWQGEKRTNGENGALLSLCVMWWNLSGALARAQMWWNLFRQTFSHIVKTQYLLLYCWT